MENAADALKMAFGVIVFVIAMAIALSLLSQANATTREIFYSMDTITYLEQANESQDDANHRIVGLETIVPTIYRYPVENCGVTIVRKNNDGNYELIARYDVETENVASQIANVKQYKYNENIERYKQAAKIYYTHINYLVTNLKITIDDEVVSLFPKGNNSINVYDVEYQSNDELTTRINELYTYYTSNNKNSDESYGAPWGTQYVAERLKSDFSGGDELVTIDGNYYDVGNFGDEDDLLSYLDGKEFKEYIIEVDTSYDLTYYSEYFGGNSTSTETLQTSEKKLEIIYVEQQE